MLRRCHCIAQTIACVQLPAVIFLGNVIPEDAVGSYICSDSRLNACDIGLLELTKPAKSKSPAGSIVK